MSDQLSEYPCAARGCSTTVQSGQQYCSRHRPKGNDHLFKQAYTNAGAEWRRDMREAARMRDGKEVCPLYADEPVFFGHHTWCESVDGAIVERCACGFVRVLPWHDVAMEAKKKAGRPPKAKEEGAA